MKSSIINYINFYIIKINQYSGKNYDNYANAKYEVKDYLMKHGENAEGFY